MSKDNLVAGITQPNVDFGKTVSFGPSEYLCEGCGFRLLLVRIGPLGKPIYECPECNVLYLTNWSKPPYHGAKKDVPETESKE